MRAKEKEKIEDYIAGLYELESPVSFPIGVIVIDEKDRKKVLDMLKKGNVRVIETDARHPDVVLEDLIKAVKGGLVAALSIKTSLHQKIFNQLSNLASGVIYTELAGKKEPVMMTSFPAGAKIVLVMNKEYYREFLAQDIISSVCQL